MRLFPRAVLVVAALAPGVVPAVQAEPIPWSYRSPNNEFATPVGATGGLSFPNEPYLTVTGDAIVPVTRVYSWSIAPEGNPDRAVDLPFRFDLELRDDLSAQTATLSIQGTMSGQFWRTGSNLTATFLGASSRSVEVDARQYSIDLTGFDAPQGYGDSGPGTIWASVRVGPAGPSGGGPGGMPSVGEQTPEPATVLLVGIGLPVLLVARLRRRSPDKSDQPA